jgi:hypothetical protein
MILYHNKKQEFNFNLQREAKLGVNEQIKRLFE